MVTQEQKDAAQRLQNALSEANKALSDLGELQVHVDISTIDVTHIQNKHRVFHLSAVCEVREIV